MTSIVIPHYGTPDLLRQCLAAIAAHTAEEHEVIVIDDGSEVEAQRQADAVCQNVARIAVQDHQGFTAAVNFGLRLATGAHVVSMNTDILVTENWLPPLLTALVIDPRIGIVMPQIRDACDHNYICCAGAMKPSLHRTGWADRGEWSEMRIDDDDYLPFACVLIRGECLADVGPLDEQMRIYCSDSDYCYRAQAKGWKLCYQPGSVVYHDEGSTIRQHVQDEVFINRLQNDQYYWQQKWPEKAKQS